MISILLKLLFNLSNFFVACGNKVNFMHLWSPANNLQFGTLNSKIESWVNCRFLFESWVDCRFLCVTRASKLFLTVKKQLKE